MPSQTIKEEAHRLIEQLPEDATWEDLQYQIYSRQAVEAGLTDRKGCAAVEGAGKTQALLMERAAAARELANKHYEVEDGLVRIFRLVGKADEEVSRDEPIKLLEVNENTVPSGVMPLHFGPVPAIGIPFPSVIVEVTPDEFDKIKTHVLKLPKDWEIGEELPKAAASKGGV